MRTVWAVVSMAVLTAACSFGQSSPEPIVGYWATDAGAVVQVKKVGSDYQGMIVQKRSQGDCIEALGDILLKLKGSGQHYTGQWQWWHTPSCETRYADGATVDLKDKNNTAHLCSKDPFPGSPPSECLDLKRVSNFKPSPSPR
jgi:hypothetical protein